MSVETRWAEVTSSGFARKVAETARDLRELADRVEREGKPHSSSVYTPGTEHQIAAQAVVHAVMWGLANLSLDGLVRDAADADAAARLEAAS